MKRRLMFLLSLVLFLSLMFAGCDLLPDFNLPMGQECDHDYVADVTEPTCELAGKTVYTCKTCSHSYEEVGAAALGHTPENQASCDSAQICSVCKKVLAEKLEHSYVADVQNPTCTLAGKTVYTCKTCGDSYEEAGKAALGHTPGADATCSEAQSCSVCGVVLAEKLEHNYETKTQTPTCVLSGKTVYTCKTCGDSYEEIGEAPLGHTPGAEATCSAPQVCTVCTKVLVDALEHSWTDATCTDPKTCTVCGSSEGMPLGHTAGEAVEENRVEPTCDYDGSYDSVVYCIVCDTELSCKTTLIPAFGHHNDVPVEENRVEPTCSADGFYDSVVYCSICHVELSYETIVLPALEHTEADPVEENRVEPTCSADGSYDSVVYCTVCHAELSRDTTVLPALEHTEGLPMLENNIASSCTSDGYYEIAVYCTVCHVELSRESTVVPAIPHSAGAPVTENEIAATCTSEGSYDSVAYCTVCGTEISRDSLVLDMLGHRVVTDVAVAPTCTETGLTEGSHCDRCNTVFVAQTVLPVSHSLAEGETCDRAQYCTVCGQTITSNEHIFAPATCTTPKTCMQCGVTEGTALEHMSGEPVTENYVAPTCVNDGSYEAVVYCTGCYTELSRETVVVPALDHTAGAPVSENEIAATCTADGSYESVVYCTVCSTELSRETVLVPALDHTAGTPVSENEIAATCTADGSYESVVYCTVCSTELSRETGVIPALDHTAGAPVSENEIAATCTADGSYESVVCCTVCSTELSRETVVVPAYGHTRVDFEAKEPTCTEEGYTAGAYCSVCDEDLLESVILPVIDHTRGDAATCTAPQICTVCETVLENAKGHTGGDAATCTAPQLCTECGEILVGALGHLVVVDESKKATCTETGLTEGSHCARCSEIIEAQIVVPTINHEYIDGQCKYGCGAIYDGWIKVTYVVTISNNVNIVYLEGEHPEIMVPTRDGYTFKGWYSNDSYEEQYLVTSLASITESTTLYAKWTKNSTGSEGGGSSTVTPEVPF